MENKLAKKIFENMNYNTYNKLYNLSFASSILGAFNPLLYAVIDLPVLEALLCSYSLLSQGYFFTNLFGDYEKYTKEIKNIENMYNNLINNYIVLNNNFELKNPVEIYSMYNYMLYKGYLSKDGEFIFGKSDIKDITSLLGVNVITGKAVCRHIASMLNDIYRKLDLNAYPITAYLNETDTINFLLGEMLTSLENQLKSSTDETEKQEIRDLIKETKEYKNNLKSKFEFLKRKNANHLINLVSYNDTGYILDPTNRDIYKKDPKITDVNEDILKSYLISDDQTIIKLTKDRDYYEEKRKILLLPNSDTETDKFMIEQTRTLCKNNKDLLEQFQKENNELYNEINNELVKVKKRRK